MTINVYDAVIETINRCVKEDSLRTISKKKIVFLGTNLTARFDELMQKILEENKNFSAMMIGSQSQIEQYSYRWGKCLHLYNWKEAYSTEMLNDVNIVRYLEKADILIFCTSSKVNLRDKNIIELGILINERFGVKICFYDWNEEKLYKYEPMKQYLKALKLYEDINSFLYEYNMLIGEEK